MAEERRSAPRARISGVRVTYESASGDQVETDALNLGRGGLFVRAAKPLSVGKRLSLDIQVAGELVPWSALGRVVWMRAESDGERHPAGMGVKLIDVEDAVVATIDRLVAGREHTEPGVQGVEAPAQPAPGASIVRPAPVRERTLVGVGSGFPQPAAQPAASASRSKPSAPEPVAAREPSIVLDLVAGDVASTPPPRRSRRPPELQPYGATPASQRPSPVKRGGGRRWIVVLLFLVVAGAAAYLLLGGDLDRVLRPSEPVAPPHSASELPAAPLPPAATAVITTTPTPSASTTATASARPASPAISASTEAPLSAAVPSSATGALRKAPVAGPSPLPSHAIPAKRPAAEENNPY
jgi:uncharacterized protein (TIGR02266 family)